MGVYLCYRLAKPCIASLVWAGALALIFAPLQRRLEASLKRPNLAAVISLVLVGLLLVVPATWFAQKFVEKATSLPETIQKQITAGKWHVTNEHPLIARFLAIVEQQTRLPENTPMASKWLKTIISRFLEESAMAAVQVCVTLYFFFHFLRDRVRVLKAIRSLLPLPEADIDTLFGRVYDTVHATVYGMLALSVLQGVLGGTMYWWLGIPTPWFWAFVMAAFAFVPVIDAVVVWAPAAVYLALEGRWGEALGVAALGTLFVRAIENFLYPSLVKNRSKIPSVSLFISLVGGVLLFGWCGLVLGPVIMTVTSALLEMCTKRMNEAEIRAPDRPRSESAESVVDSQTRVGQLTPLTR